MRLFGFEIRRYQKPRPSRCLTFVTNDGDVGMVPPGYRIRWVGGDNSGMDVPPNFSLRELSIPAGFDGCIGSDCASALTITQPPHP